MFDFLKIFMSSNCPFISKISLNLYLSCSVPEETEAHGLSLQALLPLVFPLGSGLLERKLVDR